MTPEQIIMVWTFVVLALGGYGLTQLLLRDPRERLRDRMHKHDTPAAVSRPRENGPVAHLLGRVGRTAGKPFVPRTREERSALRRELGYAGLYTASAVHLVAGLKAMSLGGGLSLGYLAGAATNHLLLGLAFGGLLGYAVPVFWLQSRIRQQRKALTRGLPDALDLMVVCVEAGLTLDSALQRVGNEINLAHPKLAREWSMVHLESQVGVSRHDALKNLAQRTGCDALQALTAMLVQADRFGTSIAQTLRIYAESLRLKRQHLAEEMASKAAVKLTLPLVLCIFPATLVVVAGPGAIKIIQSGLFGG